MAREWTPAVGDEVVDLFVNGRPNGVPNRCGPVVQIKTITQNLVFTTEGERYSRSHMKPVSEGRYSARELVRADDDRVLCVRGREVLASVARVAGNLADLPRTDPADITAALARLVVVADDGRRRYAAILAGKPAPEERV